MQSTPLLDLVAFAVKLLGEPLVRLGNASPADSLDSHQNSSGTLEIGDWQLSNAGHVIYIPPGLWEPRSEYIYRIAVLNFDSF